MDGLNNPYINLFCTQSKQKNQFARVLRNQLLTAAPYGSTNPSSVAGPTSPQCNGNVLDPKLFLFLHSTAAISPCGNAWPILPLADVFSSWGCCSSAVASTCPRRPPRMLASLTCQDSMERSHRLTMPGIEY